jgi:hypothetical protein
MTRPGPLPAGPVVQAPDQTARRRALSPTASAGRGAQCADGIVLRFGDDERVSLRPRTPPGSISARRPLPPNRSSAIPLGFRAGMRSIPVGKLWFPYFRDRLKNMRFDSLFRALWFQKASEEPKGDREKGSAPLITALSRGMWGPWSTSIRVEMSLRSSSREVTAPRSQW